MQSIRILGIDYSIERVPQIDSDPLICGTSEDDQCKIIIKENLKQELYNEILLHEIIHQIDDRLQLLLTEDQIIRLAAGLNCVSRENNIELVREGR